MKSIRKALFPISVSNQRYSTEGVALALKSLAMKYDRVVFIIADSLQVYNKGLLATKGLPLNEIVSRFNQESEYLSQRKRWIANLEKNNLLGGLVGEWEILSTDELSDRKCFGLYRNILLLFNIDEKFRYDILKEARNFAARFKPDYPLKEKIRLSTAYLLEEIALSIRLHVLDGIQDEYYLGELSGVIYKLYSGSYSLNVFEISDSSEQRLELDFYTGKDIKSKDDWNLRRINCIRTVKDNVREGAESLW